MRLQIRTDLESCSDLELAARIARRDEGAVRIVTQRNNQRLFRAAWSILKDRDDAEDAVQGAYLRGFRAIAGFEGKSSLSTWLTRIAINEALGRLRATRRRAHAAHDSVLFLDDYREKMMRGSSPPSPEESVARDQVRALLEQAIGALPPAFRTVFVLRDVEGMSVAEAAEILDILPATVKTRHLRARVKLRERLSPGFAHSLTGAFPFAGVYCGRVTARLIEIFCRARPAPRRCEEVSR
jgi:RNA polymerase sigma-70 factor (ECF subfamily)